MSPLMRRADGGRRGGVAHVYRESGLVRSYGPGRIRSWVGSSRTTGAHLQQALPFQSQFQSMGPAPATKVPFLEVASGQRKFQVPASEVPFSEVLGGEVAVVATTAPPRGILPALDSVQGVRPGRCCRIGEAACSNGGCRGTALHQQGYSSDWRGLLHHQNGGNLAAPRHSREGSEVEVRT